MSNIILWCIDPFVSGDSVNSDANLNEIRANQEHLKELTRMETHHKRMMAKMESQLEKMRPV
jgi:hypothetical protein